MNWREMSSQMKTLMGIVHGSRSFGGPFQANLSLTDRCNMRCIHCYYHSPALENPPIRVFRRANRIDRSLPEDDNAVHIQSIDTDADRMRALILDLIEMGTRRFHFSGGGEPLLHENALEFVDLIKRAGCNSLINTNGILLTRSTIDELMKIRYDELRITLMGGDRETYLRTHPGTGVETYDNLKENLIYLAERKRASRSSLPEVGLVYVIINENSESLFDFAEFASEVKAERVLFRPIDDVDDRGLAKLVPTVEQSISVSKQLLEVDAYLESLGIGHNIDNFLNVFNEKLDTTALYHLIPCYYGWLSVSIEADGSVFPCCRSYTPLGNFHEENFRDIWNGEAYRKFRKEAAGIPRRKTPVQDCRCDSCIHHTANLHVYRMLHLVKGRSARLKHMLSLSSGVKKDENVRSKADLPSPSSSYDKEAADGLD